MDHCAAFGDALRCGLTGDLMTDPVIVWTRSNPSGLVHGRSYERLALEQWLRECSDGGATRYGPNTALKELGLLYRKVGGAASMCLE